MFSHSMITRRDKILMYTIRINITVFYIRIDLTNLVMQNVVYWSYSNGLLSETCLHFQHPNKICWKFTKTSASQNRQNRMLFNKVIEKIKREVSYRKKYQASAFLIDRVKILATFSLITMQNLIVSQTVCTCRSHNL